MKTQDIERVIANKIADYWYKEIHGQTAPIFGKQKLRDFAEAELKKLRIPHVRNNEVVVCPHCSSKNNAKTDNYFCLDCNEPFTAK